MCRRTDAYLCKLKYRDVMQAPQSDKRAFNCWKRISKFKYSVYITARGQTKKRSKNTHTHACVCGTLASANAQHPDEKPNAASAETRGWQQPDWRMLANTCKIQAETKRRPTAVANIQIGCSIRTAGAATQHIWHFSQFINLKQCSKWQRRLCVNAKTKKKGEI